MSTAYSFIIMLFSSFGLYGQVSIKFQEIENEKIESIILILDKKDTIINEIYIENHEYIFLSNNSKTFEILLISSNCIFSSQLNCVNFKQESNYYFKLVKVKNKKIKSYFNYNITNSKDEVKMISYVKKKKIR